MPTASSAMRTWRAARSPSEKTATDARPRSRQARIIRTAISPRLAIRIFCKAAQDPSTGAMRGGGSAAARAALFQHSGYHFDGHGAVAIGARGTRNQERSAGLEQRLRPQLHHRRLFGVGVFDAEADENVAVPLQGRPHVHVQRVAEADV